MHVVDAPVEQAKNSAGKIVGDFYPCSPKPFYSTQANGDPIGSQIYVHETFFNERMREAVADAWRDAALFYTKEGGAVNMDLLAVANQKRMQK